MVRLNVRRQDLISYEKVEAIKRKLNLKQKDICDLLQVNNATRYRYECEGLVPLLRFQAIINALKLDAQQKYQDRIKLIDDIINSDD